MVLDSLLRDWKIVFCAQEIEKSATFVKVLLLVSKPLPKVLALLTRSFVMRDGLVIVICHTTESGAPAPGGQEPWQKVGWALPTLNAHSGFSNHLPTVNFCKVGIAHPGFRLLWTLNYTRYFSRQTFFAKLFCECSHKTTAITSSKLGQCSIKKIFTYSL